MKTAPKSLWSETTELRMIRSRMAEVRRMPKYNNTALYARPDDSPEFRKLNKRRRNLTQQIVEHIGSDCEKMLSEADRRDICETIIKTTTQKIKFSRTIGKITRFGYTNNINSIVDGLTLGGDYAKKFLLQWYIRDPHYPDYATVYADFFVKSNPWIKDIDVKNSHIVENVATAVAKEYRQKMEDGFEPSYIKSCLEWFSAERFVDLIKQNPYLADAVKSLDSSGREIMRRRAMLTELLNTIPESYPELYPVARSIKRKFYLHIGETNSGKTYEALEALKKAGGGIYLAPLRLLAYEKYVELNMAECPCNMITGEEAKYIDGAAFQSSTVELIDLNEYYPVTVIDEAQMIADKERGGRWTTAILGAYSKEIHVCMAPEAKDIVTRLIEECGDSYEIIEHHRSTQLIEDVAPFSFPDDVQKNDAIVVFSRSNVHAVAAHLKRKGMSVSIIYGSLPYDVRQEQARLFVEGETDVVVCTDAIGMGMNLPIKRIVFLELSKFDGISRRFLLPNEVRQIAGRAGRLGLYDQGFYTADTTEKGILRRLMATPVPIIESALIDFPPTLLNIDLKLSELLEKWVSMDKTDGYVTSLTDREIRLAKKLEEKTDDKDLVYRFVSIPFDEGKIELYRIWKDMAKKYIAGETVNETDISSHINFSESSDLPKLEIQSKICDLFYQILMKNNGSLDLIEKVNSLKQRCSVAIMSRLEKSEFQEKKCTICKRVLAWNYPYRMCHQCYHIQSLSIERSSLS